VNLNPGKKRSILDLPLLSTPLDFFLQPNSFNPFVFGELNSLFALFLSLFFFDTGLIQLLFLDEPLLFFLLLYLVLQLF
jgi:hypothetical protein